MKLECKEESTDSLEFLSMGILGTKVLVSNKDGLVMTIILTEDQIEDLARKLIRKPAIVF